MSHGNVSIFGLGSRETLPLRVTGTLQIKLTGPHGNLSTWTRMTFSPESHRTTQAHGNFLIGSHGNILTQAHGKPSNQGHGALWESSHLCTWLTVYFRISLTGNLQINLTAPFTSSSRELSTWLSGHFRPHSGSREASNQDHGNISNQSHGESHNHGNFQLGFQDISAFIHAHGKVHVSITGSLTVTGPFDLAFRIFSPSFLLTGSFKSASRGASQPQKLPT